MYASPDLNVVIEFQLNIAIDKRIKRCIELLSLPLSVPN